jgi:uncharacterized protein YbjQ (UPF0145 family)
MTNAPSDLPEATQRRFADGAFSSDLSVPDFAACLQMGLTPVGLVQGFCAMQWSKYAGGGLYQRSLSPYGGDHGGYVENYQCPHGMISTEHRMWGQNYEQTWIEESWMSGFTAAYTRMVEEATQLGAHGIVGVLDTVTPLSDLSVIEFHFRGTAVTVDDVPRATSAPWTTYLAGQRLAKIFEAGYAPVSVVASVASVRVWAYCMTEYLLGGGGMAMWAGTNGPTEIGQIVNAKLAAREIVRTHIRRQLLGDALHGVAVQEFEREFEKGDLELQAILRGNRLRRVATVEPLPVPKPTVRLS